MNENDMRNVSVIGIGNILMSDDGVGIHAVLKLREMGVPEGIEVFDAGSDVFYALEAMWGRNKAIILDACHGNNAPGALYRFTFEQLQMKGEQNYRLSMHDMNFMYLIAVYYMHRTPFERVKASHYMQRCYRV